MRIRIGDLLVRAGVITELQLKAALAEQQQWGGKLGSITQGKKIETQLAGASAIRNAISRWYRGEELLRDEVGEEPGMKIVNNAGDTVVDMRARKTPVPKGKAAASPPARESAVDVLRGVEETQRRSVAALKAMVELLIEKGVFSRDEYLARVKR